MLLSVVEKKTTTNPLRLGQILINNHVPQQYIDYAIKEQSVRKQKLFGQILLDESLVNPEIMARAIAQQLNMVYFSIFTGNLQEGLEIDKDIILKNEVIPIREDKGFIEIGMTDPNNMTYCDNVVRYIRQTKNKEVKISVISSETFQRYLESLYDINIADILKHLTPNTSSVSVYDLYKTGDNNADANAVIDKEHASDALRLLLKKAVIEKASDIHIEPTIEGGRIRFRKNGILHIITSIDIHQYTKLINLVRIVSNMNIVEKRLPQDGRIDGSFLNDEKYQAIDCRVSSIPNWSRSGFSDSIVIRILDKRTSVLPLAQLGISSEVLNFLSSAKNKSHGIIIFTGPTGSGKTTTIYSTMATINTIEKAVVTVEDPVEYRNYLWKQIQVDDKKGFDFALALRSILRHDPDIIFCGEIRDKETARIAFDMANTGHLVFTTLHANDSVKAFTRLLSLDVSPAMIESACLGVVAQRLIRVFCECKGAGCESCNWSGYKGRTMVSEYFPVTDNTYNLLQMVLTGNVLESRKMLSEIYPDMRSNALKMVKDGLTSEQEVDRVV